jgi:hypothetical protein
MIKGRYTLWEISEAGLWTPLFSRENTLMATFGWAACRLFGFGDTDYRISRVYIEYENVTLPADPVTPPSYDANDSRSYYDNLSSPRDYLRVPVIGNPDVQIASGYEGLFTEGVDGNKLVFFAQTAGTSGENGVAFSNAVNSKVFGLALVAAPVDSDKTQDVIITRGYYATADQKVKDASAQIGVTWELDFKPS